MAITAQDKTDLIRMASLIGRQRSILSTFEAELVDDCVLRFRDRGDRVNLTPNERLVLCDALLAMEKAQAEQAQADADAATAMRGAA
jgi:hypothetical protein